MAKDQVLLTPQGLEKLKKEYERLVKVERPKVIEEIRITRAMGDLSENGGYQTAKERQRFLDRRIRELEHILKTAKASTKALSKNKVSVGSTVVLQNTKNNMQMTYTLVGATEADPSAGKISYESPLGRKILGKKPGDIVEITTPGGKLTYKIKEIKS